jgi:antitoxin HicB
MLTAVGCDVSEAGASSWHGLVLDTCSNLKRATPGGGTFARIQCFGNCGDRLTAAEAAAARCDLASFDTVRQIAALRRYATDTKGCHRRGRVGTKEYSYTVLFEPAEEGGYIVTCPALQGVVTQGESLAQARAMAADAIRGYLESLQKDGLPIPPDAPPAEPIKEKVKVVLGAA